MTPLIRYNLIRAISNFEREILFDHAEDLYNNQGDNEEVVELAMDYDGFLQSYMKNVLELDIHDGVKEAFKRRLQKEYFKTQITEELIAEAMHPRRIQTQMNHFDDIEAYFEAMV